MRPTSCLAALPALLLAFMSTRGAVAFDAQAPGVVCHVNVVSDKVPDVSSPQAWEKSFLRDGMTNQEKALALWKSVVAFEFDCPPPNEFLEYENCVKDPIKTFNVYGYGICSDISAHVEALGQYVGFQTRGWALNGHSVPEVFYDNGWHMLDAAYLDYWPKADGQLSGMEEMGADINAWMGKNAGYRGNEAKLREFGAKGGWRNGPETMSRCPTLDENGTCPEGLHGWWGFVRMFDQGSKRFVYDYGGLLGYEVNIQLCPGERLVRNWGHKGLNVNMGGGEGPDLTPVGTGVLAFSPKYGDLAPGRVGNGRLEYDVPLAQVARSAFVHENLEAKGTGVQIADATKPGVLVLRVPSSYVYLSGELTLKAAVGNAGEIVVQFSDNNGLDWKGAAPSLTASGEQKIDLKKLVFRRYDYRLKFTLKGAGTALEAVKLTHDIQHSQRALPALGQGENKITFSTGAQEGTITLEGSMYPENKEKQLTIEDFHPVLEGLKPANLRPDGQGQAVLIIATPADMTRLRMSLNYRARDARDSYNVEVSFDEGTTFKPLGKAQGPTTGNTVHFVFSEVPAGSKSAQIRLVAKQVNTTMVFAMRIDADYKQPNAGFRPVKITYNWEENGQAKQDVHVAKQKEETYTISCSAKPAMKSITLELAE